MVSLGYDERWVDDEFRTALEAAYPSESKPTFDIEDGSNIVYVNGIGVCKTATMSCKMLTLPALNILSIGLILLAVIYTITVLKENKKEVNDDE